MMKLELEDGTILKVYRTLYETRLGGVSAFYRPVSPPADSLRRPNNISKDDVNRGNLEYI